MTKVGLGTNRHTGSEDLGQCLDEGPFLLPVPTPQLEIEQVEATVEKTAVIGDLSLDVLGQLPTPAQIIQIRL